MFSVCYLAMNKEGEGDFGAARSIDASMRHKWRWEWLGEKDGDVTRRQWCVKVNRPGVCLCKVCNTEIIYGISGVKRLREHAARPDHQMHFMNKGREGACGTTAAAFENAEDPFVVAAVQGFASHMDQSLLLSSARGGVTSMLPCHDCGRRFVLERVREVHRMLDHGDTPVKRCQHCGMQFLQLLSYNRHMATNHQPRRHPCRWPSCGQTFFSKTQTRAHHFAHRRQIRRATKLVSGGMVVTENQESEKEAAWTVGEVGEASTRADLPGSGTEGAEATDSWMEFYQAGKRAPNKKRNFEGRATFKCPHCPAHYPHLSKLRYHVRTHTGEKPFQCTECPMSFRTSAQRFTHRQRRHCSARPHLCDLCGKRFKDQRTLDGHTRTHTGERPYTCPHCTRSFGKPEALKIHLRQHSGEKPYVCDQCGQAFTVRVSLRTHLKAKHGIVVDTSAYHRPPENPDDPAIPAIGRPKRKEAERQLSVKALAMQEESNASATETYAVLTNVPVSGDSSSTAAYSNSNTGHLQVNSNSLTLCNDNGSSVAFCQGAHLPSSVATSTIVLTPVLKEEVVLFPELTSVAMKSESLC